MISRLKQIQNSLESRLKPIQSKLESRLKPNQSKLESGLKPILENVEDRVGMPLLDAVGTLQRKSCKLVGPKQVFLPRCGVFIKYYERRPITMKDTAFDSYKSQKRPIQARYPPPTLLLCHGVGSGAAEYCSLLRGMSIPPHVRVLIPDHVGLSEELRHADREMSPQRDVLESTAEFLDVVLREGSSCNAVGTSLGGELLYFLRAMRPELIQKTVLVAPTIPSVLTAPFCDALGDGSSHNPFVAFGCRDETARAALFRNFLWTDPTARIGKKEPLPVTALSFLLENMYQRALRDFFRREHKPSTSDGVPDGDGTQATATDGITTAESSSIFATTTDLDQDCNRLLVWPEEDQISNFEKGKQFFQPSLESGTTRIETIPGCGHMFDANLKLVHERIAPLVEEFLLDFSDE